MWPGMKWSSSLLDDTDDDEADDDFGFTPIIHIPHSITINSSKVIRYHSNGLCKYGAILTCACMFHLNYKDGPVYTVKEYLQCRWDLSTL